MTTATHTSGPWEMHDGKHRQAIYAQWHGERTRIAETGLVLNQNRSSQPDYEGENRANARLIAAAPDLLAAIRAILFQVVQGKVLERDACIAQARAAIAKAEGV